VLKILSILLIVLVDFNACMPGGQGITVDGYDLTKPVVMKMPAGLNEISGITFNKGNPDTLYAEQDEEGSLFYFATNNTNNIDLHHTKFGKKGDYEDLAVLNNNYFVVLRSDGSLFKFPVSEIAKEVIDSVQEYKHILPEGEYEGLAAYDGKLLVLCKSCPVDKGTKAVSAYVIQPDANGALSVGSSFSIDVSMIKKKGEKEKFNPSCIAKNPVTNQWYIISSVNKSLVVLDEEFTIKESFPLDPSLFNQPEGLAFDSNGDMYISNEGGAGTADILLFRYQK